jgi:hypothetical protein
MKRFYTQIKLLFTLLVALTFSLSVYAQPPGWSYSQAYHIVENSGVSLQDYQVRLTLNTQALIAAGQMNADGSDLRFSVDCGAGASFLEYCIISGLNTTSTTIWIKIPVILANSTIPLYVFYGNPAATAMSSIGSVFIGPMSSTDSVASGGAGGATNSQRGFRFGVNEEILVTHFGKREPNGTTRYVTLFDFNTQAIITQTQVSGPAAEYSYSSITDPVWLTPGNQYVLELYQGNSDGYYFGTSSQIGQELIYYDMRYCNSCTQNTFPTNVLTNYHYGYPDLWYYKRQHASIEPTINAAPAFVADAGADQTICNGNTITLTATGGVSYVWSNSETTDAISVSPSSTTTYIVTATNNAGCTDTASVTVIVNPIPVASAGNSQTICSGETATLTATGGNTYLWSTNENTATVLVTPTNTTTYSVTVTDNNNCSNTASATVNVNALPNASAGSDQTICNGETATLTANGGNTYLWSTNENTASVSVAPTNTTTYSVTVTDNNNCSSTASATVNVNALPNASAGSNQTICNGETATLTANGGNTYLWSTTENTAAISVTPTTTSVYSVTVTDNNNCSSTASATVNVNALPNASAGSDQTICNGETATLTANGGDTYLWSTTENTASVSVTPTTTTAYTVTVTDNNNCSNTASATVTVNALPNASAGSDQTICNGETATLTATGGDTYLWSTNGNTASVSVTPTTTTAYTVTVTDNNNCSNTASATVTVNALPNASAGTDQQICNGQSATLDAIGGNSYVWSTSETTASITVSPVTTTTYEVTVTDASNCSATAATTVTVNDLPNASAANDQTICNGQTATLTATGGDDYIWSTTETTASISVSPVSTTTYSVTVTDINNCSNTASATITVNDLPVVSITGTSTICAGDTVTLTATGGSTFNWNNGETTATIDVAPQSNDSYTVTVTNGNNCSATASASITVNPLPAAPVISASGNTLTSTQASTYQWYLNNGAISGATAQSVNATTGGVYSVVITDANGCSNVSSDFVYTSIASINTSNRFDIYPNPSSGIINVQQLNSTDIVYIKVTNVSGEEVFRSQFSKNMLIDLTQHAAGMYVVYLSGKFGNTTYKINLTR